MNKKEQLAIKIEILNDIKNCIDWKWDIENNFSYSYLSKSKLADEIEKYEYILEGMNYNEN